MNQTGLRQPPSSVVATFAMSSGLGLVCKEGASTSHRTPSLAVSLMGGKRTWQRIYDLRRHFPFQVGSLPHQGPPRWRRLGIPSGLLPMLPARLLHFL